MVLSLRLVLVIPTIYKGWAQSVWLWLFKSKTDVACGARALATFTLEHHAGCHLSVNLVSCAVSHLVMHVKFARG